MEQASKPLRGFARAADFVRRGVWTLDPDACARPRRFAVQAVRLLTVTVGGFLRHHCSLHAAGLTYFSILSIVPVLLLMLFLTKPCGLYDWARGRLVVYSDNAITAFFEAKPAASAAPKTAEASAQAAAFGTQARQLRNQILAQIDDKINHFNFGLMALVGFGMLAWTVASTLGQVEESLNEIWNVAKSRPIWKKLSLYVLAVMVLPLLGALAMSLPVLRVAKGIVDATLGATAYTKWAGDALVALLTSRLLGYALTLLFASLALAFVFRMLPNRRVSARAALEGGLVTAVLLGAWLKLCALLQFGISNAGAAWGSFALLPILIVWIYMSWQILLLGSCLCYALECVHHRVPELSRL